MDKDLVAGLALTSITVGILLGMFLERNLAPKPIPLPPQLPLYEIESRCRDQVRKEATEAGVAYFALNQKTGLIEFHYVDMNKILRSIMEQMNQKVPHNSGVLQ